MAQQSNTAAPIGFRPRRTLAVKLFLSLLACLLLMVGLIWMLNSYVLPSYYRNAKERVLIDLHDRIDQLLTLEEGTEQDLVYNGLAETSQEELLTFDRDNNLRIVIWGHTAIPGTNTYRMIFDSRNGTMLHKDQYREWSNLGLLDSEYALLDSEDPINQTPTLRLLGTTEDGYGVLISMPLAAIDESVAITNQFLLISGAAALVVGGIVMLAISRSFSRPIRDLSRIAASMARLDFSDRYPLKGRDELSALGDSINRMAAALEANISGLKSANLRLAGDVEEKTRQNNAHRAFISNVSHELKTPISLIRTYAEGLRENLAGDAATRDYYCEVIEDEAEKMNVMIRKMTMLMQLESGREELVIERFDVADLLRNLVTKYRPRFEEKNVAPPIVPDRTAYVWADPFLTENVLTNYLTNALNHVEEGGRILTGVTPCENGHVRITVFNSGKQIPEEDLPRIWDSFYKTDKARTRAYGGTGIGLSVVAAIMNAHCMPYGVSNYTDGVEFYIELDSRAEETEAPDID